MRFRSRRKTGTHAAAISGTAQIRPGLLHGVLRLVKAAAAAALHSHYRCLPHPRRPHPGSLPRRRFPKYILPLPCTRAWNLVAFFSLSIFAGMPETGPSVCVWGGGAGLRSLCVSAGQPMGVEDAAGPGERCPR